MRKLSFRQIKIIIAISIAIILMAILVTIASARSETKEVVTASILDGASMSVTAATEPDELRSVIWEVLDADILTDYDTETTLRRILEDMDAGIDVDSDMVREVLNYAFREMLSAEHLTEEQREARDRLLEKYTNYSETLQFASAEEMSAFISTLLEGGLVYDQSAVLELQEMLAILSEENGVAGVDSDTFASLRDRLREIVNSVYVAGVGGSSYETYYRQLVSRYTSPQFTYLQSIAYANAEDISRLEETIRSDETISAEQREQLIQVLEQYCESNTESLLSVYGQLQDMVDNNTQMDAQTRLELITLMQQLISNEDANLSSVQSALFEQIYQNNLADIQSRQELEQIIATLDTQTLDNLRSLDLSLRTLNHDTIDSLVRTVNAYNFNLVNSINTQASLLAASVNQQSHGLVDSINAQAYELASAVNSQATDLAQSMNTYNIENATSINSIVSEMGDQATYTITYEEDHPILTISVKTKSDSLPRLSTASNITAASISAGQVTTSDISLPNISTADLGASDSLRIDTSSGAIQTQDIESRDISSDTIDTTGSSDISDSDISVEGIETEDIDTSSDDGSNAIGASDSAADASETGSDSMQSTAAEH